MEDIDIIKLFLSRSETAINALSDKYESVLERLCRNILNDIEDAKECVNDTYFSTWNTIPPQIPEQLCLYVCKVARNLSLKKYRFNTAQKRNSYYDISMEELEWVIPSNCSIDEELSNQELAKVIDDFLDTLDLEERVMFVRRYWYSDSVKQIANRFGLFPNQVSVKLGRTRKKMQKYLKEAKVWE